MATTTGLALSAALAACIELVPVGPPEERPPILHLSLHLTDPIAARPALPAPVRLTATLSPGIDPIGAPRAVVDDTLWVLDLPFLPVELGPEGRRRYSADFPVDPERVIFGSIPIRPPHLAGVPATRVEIRWPVAWQPGPGSITLPPGGDLLLHIALSGAPEGPAPTFQRWSASLFHSAGWFSQGGDGLPPTEMRVPATFLGSPGAPHLAITSLNQSADLVLGEAGYSLRIDLSQEVRWTAVIDASASASDSPTDSGECDASVRPLRSGARRSQPCPWTTH